MQKIVRDSLVETVMHNIDEIEYFGSREDLINASEVDQYIQYGTGYIEVDEKHRTSNPKIYAGGDIAGDKGTIAWAARAGREAACTIENGLI